MVGKAVVHGALGVPDAVALGVTGDPLLALPGPLRGEADQQVAVAAQVLGLQLDVGGAAAEPGRALVHEHLAVREHVPLAGCALGEEVLPGTVGHAQRHGAHVARHEVHEVADGEHRGDQTAGRADQEGDVRGGVLRGEQQELGGQGRTIVLLELAVQQQYALVQEAGGGEGGERGALRGVGGVVESGRWRGGCCHGSSVRRRGDLRAVLRPALISVGRISAGRRPEDRRARAAQPPTSRRRSAGSTSTLT